MNIPLTEKYRPKHLDEILGNEEVVISLRRMLDTDNLPHMLFYGPPGTGKTTTIKAIAKMIYKKHYNSSVLELNASDERGIDTVRNTIKTFAGTLSFGNQRKLIILDEADSMSRDAQNAMRRIIEDNSKNVRFCLIANFSSKIIGAIHSRCAKFRFSPVSSASTEEKIKEICNAEKYEYTQDGIDTLIKISDGDMRKMINDIEGVHSCYGVINSKNIYLLSGLVEENIFDEFFDELLEKEFDELKRLAVVLKENYSVDCESLVANISEVLIRSSVRNKMMMLKCLSDIQYRLSIGCSEEIQLDSFLSVFILHRN